MPPENSRIINQKYLSIGGISAVLLGFLLGYFEYQYGLLPVAVDAAELIGLTWLMLLLIFAFPITGIHLFRAIQQLPGIRSGWITLQAFLLHISFMLAGLTLTIIVSHYTIPIFLDIPILATVTKSETFGLSSLIEILKSIQSILAKWLIPWMGLVIIIAVISTMSQKNVKFDWRFDTFQSRITRGFQYVLWPMPFATFALSFSLVALNGEALAGMVGKYIMIIIALLIMVLIIIYLFSFVFLKISMGTFSRSLLPCQVVGASTRSSLATLPIMLREIEKVNIPKTISGLILPVSVSVFRLNRSVSSIFSFLLLMHLYEIPISVWDIASYGILIIFLSFASPGIPSAGKLITMPILMGMGVPIEMIILLKSIDGIPDIFKTVLNVSESFTITAAVGQWNTGHQPAYSQQFSEL